MLPDAHDAPSALAKLTRRAAVAKPIAFNLPHPIIAIVRRKPEMAWTAVPEAPVHEDQHTRSTKDKIGVAEQRLMPAPARDARFAQQRQEDLLGARIVAAEHPAHNP
jgi:hypothetical protein